MRRKDVARFRRKVRRKVSQGPRRKEDLGRNTNFFSVRYSNVFMEYVCNRSGVCMEYVRNTHAIPLVQYDMEYVWNMLAICV